MTRKRAVLSGPALAAAVAVAAVTAATASARTEAPAAARALAAPAQLQLSAAARSQLRSLGTKARVALRRVQASGSGVVCTGGTGSSGGGTQTCTIPGASGICIEISNDPAVNQTCTFTQASTGGRNNVAVALQVIVQRDYGPSGSQTGTQTVKTVQTNTTRSNLSFVTQILKQSLGTGAFDPDGEVAAEAIPESLGELLGVLPDFSSLVANLQATEPATEGDEPATPPAPGTAVTQTQQSQQTVNVCQGAAVLGADCAAGAMTGNNLSSVYQSLRQRERAANADSIDQEQNPTTGSCSSPAEDGTNMCAVVEQHTTGGKNASGLAELYRQFQSGVNTGSLTQNQDAVLGGVDHNVVQESVGVPAGPKRDSILTLQLGRQVQRAANAGVLAQSQDPYVGKGFTSSQTGSDADTWTGRQYGIQLQTNNGQFSGNHQQQTLNYYGTSTGTFNVFQQGTENGSTATNSCSGTGVCAAAVVCTSAPSGDSQFPAGCAPAVATPPEESPPPIQ
jgi:hypothetical protein